VAMSLTSPY